jgi:hypothetical protein
LLLVHTKDNNLLDKNINIKENNDVLLDANKEDGIETNSCFITRLQDKNHHVKVANIFSEHAAKFKHMETTLTNQNFIQKERAN